MIDILQLPLGPLQTNCYILACQETMKAAVIDPSWDGRSIVATADERGYEISHILLTHSHFDHVGGLADLKAETAVPIYIHPEAVTMLALWPTRPRAAGACTSPNRLTRTKCSATAKR
jgi:hydroxyacylglutathione hydrolase